MGINGQSTTFCLHYWIWHTARVSNPEPLVLETSALPIELAIHYLAERLGLEPRNLLSQVDGLANRSDTITGPFQNLVPPRELESRTFRLSSGCSNQLSYGGIYGGRQKSRTPSAFGRTWFSRPVAGPSPLHYLPFKTVFTRARRAFLLPAPSTTTAYCCCFCSNTMPTHQPAAAVYPVLLTTTLSNMVSN